MDRLQSMRAFEQVVAHGGFAAAARAMDVAPAVVTRLVADLEAHLRTRLLARTTRRMALTPAGEAYLAQLRPILQQIARAEEEASAQTDEPAGWLRVGAAPTLASLVLAPLVAGFRSLYPRVLLDIHTDALGQWSLADCDVLLLGIEVQLPADAVRRPIAELPNVLVAASRYVARHGMPGTPEQLREHPWLEFQLPGTRPQAHVKLHRAAHAGAHAHTVDAPCTPVLRSNHSDTVLRAALEGAGIAAVSYGFAWAALASGDLVRVLPEWTSGRSTLSAALPSRQFLPQRTRVFVDYLIAEVGRQVDAVGRVRG